MFKKQSETDNQVNGQRRHLLTGAAATAGLSMVQLPFMQVAQAAGVGVGAGVLPAPALAPIKQIRAGELDVGYFEAGPANGKPVILLHGWPYDIHSYAEVAPMLAAVGYRVIVPHLRAHGTTRFLSDSTFRNAQQAVVALDIIALMDALQIEKAILAGYDWGARTANIIAALWPQRCKAMVSVNGYLINNLERNKIPLPPKAEHGWWYQFYFATDRGQAGYEKYRREFRSE